METIELEVNVRSQGAKREARRLRRRGRLPGILYGPKVRPVPLELDSKTFGARVAGLEGSHLVRMKSSAPELAGKVALVKEMQYHPVSGEILHADFYEVDLTAKIQVRVPLHFVGKAAGVVRGGILQPVVREIEVECLPLDIPEFFEVEVSQLDIGDSLHVEDLRMPEGVTAIFDSNFTLVTVVPPTVEEAPAAPEAAPEAPAAAPPPEAETEGGGA
ncbi:MAG TPA: 50S ribosomal protein L25 [Candidatus Eisenbacteria bacterium]|nr:50S ribosomal protein L25 [Candidatus Eisenbacteria bacterium]